jgi:hypothetical protein
MGNFLATLYQFVVRSQKMSLVPLSNLADRSLRLALELIHSDLLVFNLLRQPARAA